MNFIQNADQPYVDAQLHGPERKQAKALKASITMGAAHSRRPSVLLDLPYRGNLGLAMSGTPSPTGNPTGAEQ